MIEGSLQKYKNIKRGEVYYLPIQNLIPGQGTYSLMTLKDKIADAVNKWDLHWNPILRVW